MVFGAFDLHNTTILHDDGHLVKLKAVRERCWQPDGLERPSGGETIFARLSQAGDSSIPLIQLCARESGEIHRSFLSNVKLDLEIR